MATNLRPDNTFTSDRLERKVQLLTYLGLLDTSHVLSGQAGAEQRLLWVLCVALEHLGLQLSAQWPGVTGPTQGKTKSSVRAQDRKVKIQHQVRSQVAQRNQL